MVSKTKVEEQVITADEVGEMPAEVFAPVEQRWRAPDGREWVTIDTPSDEIKAAWPEGTLEIPMVPIPPVDLDNLPYRILKTTIWERMSEDEGAAVYTALQAQKPLFKGLYDAAVYLYSNDQKLWPGLHDLIANTVAGGAARADQILSETGANNG